MSLLVAVVTCNQGRIFTMGRSSVGGGAGRVNTSGWGKVFASLFSISLTLFLFLLLSSLLVRGFAMFGPQGMWGLVRGQSLLGKWLGSRIPSGGREDLKLGYGSVSWALTLGATLIHLSEDKRGLKAGFCLSLNRFFD